MHNDNPKLVLNDLPPRAEELLPSEIQNIFGGCGSEGASCNENKDCCAGKACDHNKCHPHDCGDIYI